jgi:hypothetical protein
MDMPYQAWDFTDAVGTLQPYRGIYQMHYFRFIVEKAFIAIGNIYRCIVANNCINNSAKYKKSTALV